LRYADREELRANLADVLDGGPKLKKACEAASKYAHEYSPENIAKRYVDLFDSLLLERQQKL
jgi:glycosyltransferase involved in cell wall biosynthesis